MEPERGRRPLILVADDDDDILLLLSFHFERAGYEVVQARDGLEALEAARELRPALAVLDVMMPGLGGFDVTREIRADARTRSMPVVLLTARAQATDVAQGLAAGADEYVKKPFDAGDLKDRVARLLRPRLVAND
jgi:DNA-binding response OmpR family regulator